MKCLGELGIRIEEPLGCEVYRTSDGNVLKAYTGLAKPKKWIVVEDLALRMLRGAGAPGRVASGYDDDASYVLKEFVPGPSLKTLLEQESFEGNEGFWVGLESLFKGFADRGVVVTDYSNFNNIVMDEQGNPRFIDLGVAVFSEDEVEHYFEREPDDAFEDLVREEISGFIKDEEGFQHYVDTSLTAAKLLRAKALGEIRGFFFHDDKLRAY